MIKQTGETIQKAPVIGGLFKVYDSQGLPLEIILDALKVKGLVMDWHDFLTDAKGAGWTDKTIETRVEAALLDCHGKVYLEEWKGAYERYKKELPTQ